MHEASKDSAVRVVMEVRVPELLDASRQSR